MQKTLRKIARKFGYDFYIKNLNHVDSDINDSEFSELYFQCKPYTMTSLYRMYNLFSCVRYIAGNNIPGDYVECGVWRGGSSMLAALTFAKYNEDKKRQLFLYDTYEGMTKPSEFDVSLGGDNAIKTWKSRKKWAYASFEEVSSNMDRTKYLKKNIHLIKGKVEETIPHRIPNEISILRLDTDWYESTIHELTHLFPRVVKNGIVIIDDYGYWKGSRKAVDEYLNNQKEKYLLNRIDGTCRVLIKTENNKE